MVETCEENLARELLGGSLLSVKLTVLPVKAGHGDEVDLVNLQAMWLKEVVHFESFKQGSIHTEDIDDRLRLVGSQNMTGIVQNRPYFKILGSERPLCTSS